MSLPTRSFRQIGSLGIWSLINSSWIQKPAPAEFEKMDDPTSDIDLVMHVAHQQHYWLKRQENDRIRVTKQYLDHVIEYLTNAESVSQLLTAWRSQKEMPNTPRCPTSNPNERDLNEPDEEEKKYRNLGHKSDHASKLQCGKRLENRKEPTNGLPAENKHRRTQGTIRTVTLPYKSLAGQ